jgi:hypothetical protein
MVNYTRRQAPLWFTLLILTVVAIPFVALKSTEYAGGVGGSTALVGGLLLALFHGFRLTVTDKVLHLKFGIGLIQRTIFRENIVTACQVRNKFWYGFGIRLTPHGWMWNISGLDGVEITYANGRRFRVGTDDPDGLLTALGFPNEPCQ